MLLVETEVEDLALIFARYVPSLSLMDMGKGQRDCFHSCDFIKAGCHTLCSIINHFSLKSKLVSVH
jgi:hypothetical protein